ncbi:MAG: GMP synthase (glutamine-hydrolyzing) [Vezdaea aestivalis]|nr:MAG: GMP synthase (glutamine-hydrolyzing) [Vezdaea aestivalis]
MATHSSTPYGDAKKNFDTILVIDFGSQYSHLITRRLRELNVYSVMVSCRNDLKNLDFTVSGIILSGGPNSVYEPNAPHSRLEVLTTGRPVLGICYGLQEIAWQFSKGSVDAGDKREYGHAKLQIKESTVEGANKLFKGLDNDMQIWMSHGDKLNRLPEGFQTIASTTNAPFAGIVHEKYPVFGIQFHPEVSHTPSGTHLLKNFAVDICKARQHWTMETFIDLEIAKIREMVGPTEKVIGAVSGGVDSTVAAKLMQLAIGDRFYAILVDNGMMRLNECEQTEKILKKDLGIKVDIEDGHCRFLDKLEGVTDPEEKRKIIGNTFIEVFQQKAKFLSAAAGGWEEGDEVKWLLQGTLYPDVIESHSPTGGPSQTIKTHHNVGGLLKGMHLKLIEPLRELFKDEVRILGVKLGISDELIWRHPFPGPGLGIRVLGEVNDYTVERARQADHIFVTHIKKRPGLYRKLSQALAVYDPTCTVCVMGDQREYLPSIILRAVITTDFMTAEAYMFDAPEDRGFMQEVGREITNTVRGIGRVFWDFTDKPPGTIELE